MIQLTAEICETTKPLASDLSVMSRAWLLSSVLKVEILLLEVEVLLLMKASVEAAITALALLEVLATVIAPAFLLV